MLERERLAAEGFLHENEGQEHRDHAKERIRQREDEEEHHLQQP